MRPCSPVGARRWPCACSSAAPQVAPGRGGSGDGVPAPRALRGRLEPVSTAVVDTAHPRAGRRPRGGPPRRRGRAGRPGRGRAGDRRRPARRGRAPARAGRGRCSPPTAPTSRPPRRAAWRRACSTGSASPPSASPTWPPSSTSSPPPPSRRCRCSSATLPTGERVYERRVPVGVIGAVFEARPNVTVDVASQVLKARSAAVLRTGAAALGSAQALVEHVIAPALAANGVPADAVQLVPTPGHAGADALVGLPDLVPLVVVRGSGEVTRRLAALGAAAGTRVLAHADGGGVLYLDASAAEADVTRLVTDSTDRLGVCNRLNLLLIDAPAYDRLWPVAERRAARPRASSPACRRTPTRSATSGRSTPARRRTSPSRPSTARSTPRRPPPARRPASPPASAPPTRPRPRRSSTPTPAPACSGTPPPGSSTATSCSACPRPASTSTTRPGPRGPVTYVDLSLRQFVVLPPAPPAP